MSWFQRLLFFATLLVSASLWAGSPTPKSESLAKQGAASQKPMTGKPKPQLPVTANSGRVPVQARTAGSAGHSSAGTLAKKPVRQEEVSSLARQTGPRSEHSAQSEIDDRAKALPVRSAGPGRERVIVIDAGHGGKDTGAIGPSGTLEKDVVYAIARRVEALIRTEPGMRPVMVRRGDQFVDLHERADFARRVHADLFVSIHADAYVNAEAKGSSVFTLSSHGASSVAARWLADKANAADLVGGVKLRDKGKVLASVLLDLSQGATQESSDRAALRILGELEKNHHLHHRDVQKAGFVVLMSPDIPSLLVETAFISNPLEEQNLRSAQHQDKLARSIFAGIRRHFAGRTPAAPKAGEAVLLAAQP